MLLEFFHAVFYDLPRLLPVSLGARLSAVVHERLVPIVLVRSLFVLRLFLLVRRVPGRQNNDHAAANDHGAVLLLL